MQHTEHGLSQDIDNLRKQALEGLDSLSDAGEAAEWERGYLGSKGAVTALLRGLGQLPAEERPMAGRATQALRDELTAALAPIKDRLDNEALRRKLTRDAVDVTLPGRVP